MNLDYWRKENLTEKLITWAHDHDGIIKFPDQDAINALCHSSKIILPMKYGVLDVYFHYDCFYTIEYRDQVLEAFNSPVIIHYANQAPWQYEKRYHQHTKLWDKYNDMLNTKAPMYHVKEKGKTIKEKVALLLDYLKIRSIKRWYVSPDITADELKAKIYNEKR